MSKEVAEEYLSSLSDLTVNSKPLINMLTMLADENVDHAPAIVQAIESHINKVSADVKLPILYLIDSIVKNVSNTYVPLFTQNIVQIFVSVFEQVDEKVRLNMYKLRQTWSDVFPPRKLYALDLRVKDIDQAWPVTAPPPTSIHLNPKFLANKSTISEVSSGTAPPGAAPSPAPSQSESMLRDQLLKKQKILLELQHKKLELELMQTKVFLEEQQKQSLLGGLGRPVINEEAAKLLSQKALAKPKAVVMPPATQPPKPLYHPCSFWTPPLAPLAGTSLPHHMSHHPHQAYPPALVPTYYHSPSLQMAPPVAAKAKIAPVTSQLLEAVKSRDPRIARQQHHQAVVKSKSAAEVTSKEQEIVHRQIAMLKAPVLEQVVHQVPAMSALTAVALSANKGHITITVDKGKVRERMEAKSKSAKSAKPDKSKPSSKHSSSKSTKDRTESRHSKKSSPKSGRSSSSKGSPKSGSSTDAEEFMKMKRKLEKFENNAERKEPKVGAEPPVAPLMHLTGPNRSPSKAERKKLPSFKINREKEKEKERERERKEKEKAAKKAPRDRIKPVDKFAPLELEPIESSPSPEPPPPPIISQSMPDGEAAEALEVVELVEEPAGSEEDKVPTFKDRKGVSKGRNYMRRNRKDSPSPEATGDVDLRLVGPPEKQARLSYPEDPCGETEKSFVLVTGKDIDLRQLSVGAGSPAKKRLSSEVPSDEPPKKKNKSQVFDELFGHEDVDLRQISAGSRLPTPPPPPVISNTPPLPVPQIAAVAPLIQAAEPGCDSMPALEAPLEADQAAQEMEDAELLEEEEEEEGKRRSWAEVKVKPEAEVKPMSLSSQLELEMAPRKEQSHVTFETSPDKRREGGELDRLGRPLLYNRLPNDPRARRESLTLADGRDTDMRRNPAAPVEREVDPDINVNMIVAQAEEQLRNGTMSLHQYNELLKQVIRVNEVQKLREAQKKDKQQEVRRPHYHRNRRSPPGRFDPAEEDRRDRRSYNDIDERPRIPWRVPRNSELDQAAYGRGPYHRSGQRNNFDRGGFGERGRPEVWLEDRMPRNGRLQPRDRLDINEEATGVFRTQEASFAERTQDCIDLPPPDPQTLELIAKDTMKSINIDGTPRDIRFYGDTAVVMLAWDDPKEISFEGGRRHVLIGDLAIILDLNDSYQPFVLNGNTHRIRLGAPTRELYIDGDHYEAHFGGPPVPVSIGGLQYLARLDGPPPQVKIGSRRMDLVCGRVNMIVDASIMVPIYLDSKPQRFDLRCRPYILRLVNSLRTVLINEVAVPVEFGGDCKQVCGYGGNLHFLRLSVLPNNVVPGSVQVSNMETRLSPTHMDLGSNSNDGCGALTALPAPSMPCLNTISPGGGELDIFTSLMGGAVQPCAAGFNYQVDMGGAAQYPAMWNSQLPSAQAAALEKPSEPEPAGLPLLGGLNINDLFQRLVATGIVPSASSAPGQHQSQSGDRHARHVDLANPATLRERQPGMINTLYSGIQCSSCGVRFAPEETLKYSRHLDWHFRQNRREKDAARKGQSRKWYYDLSDWIQFEEIEDLEERAQSWFESEAVAEEVPEVEEVRSVAAPPGNDTACELCHDRFDTFYNEEKEEWHLKPCIVVEDKFYHPICHEDLLHVPDESFNLEKLAEGEASVEMDESVVKLSEDSQEAVEIVDESTVEAEDLKVEKEEEEAPDEDVRAIVDGLVSYLELEEASERRQEEERKMKEEEAEAGLEVLGSVNAEEKKTIIDVDLSDRAEDDEFYEPTSESPVVYIPTIIIKQEPVDDMESPVAVVDQTYTSVVASIDGNVEMSDAPAVAPAAPSKIKITFNKPIAVEPPVEKPSPIQDSLELTTDDEDPEPLPLKPKKPRIADSEITVYPPCLKGTEISGLCTIM